MTQIIAHRGASLDAPENTLTAFELALGQGADLIELDVQLDGDGTVVVHHDPTLERTTDAPSRFPDRAPWDLRTFRRAELAGLDAVWPAGRVAGPRCGLATLDEVLQRLEGRTRLLLELKDPGRHDDLVVATLAALRRAPAWLDDGDGGAVTVQSFDHAAVAAVRDELGGRVAYAWVYDDGIVPDLTTVPAWVRDLALAHHVVDRDLVAAVHDVGRRVLPWTVNDAARMRELLDVGVDAIITDAPALLRRLLEDRASVGGPPRG